MDSSEAPNVLVIVQEPSATQPSQSEMLEQDAPVSPSLPEVTEPQSEYTEEAPADLETEPKDSDRSAQEYSAAGPDYSVQV